VPIPECHSPSSAGWARAVIHNSDYGSVSECKRAIDRYFRERNAAFAKNPRRAGNVIWGKEREPPIFSERIADVDALSRRRLGRRVQALGHQPSTGTRLGAEHESAAMPNAAGDQNHVCASRPSGVSLRPHMAGGRAVIGKKQ